VAVGFEVFDEVVDSGVGVGEGVGEFDDLGFGLVDFESEPVDGEGGVVVGGVVEEGAAGGGAGGGGGGGGGGGSGAAGVGRWEWRLWRDRQADASGCARVSC